mmetsp:Transcript_23260/g.48334  ORF Transcript_23260/g.48334 Transcript_23260/m.48334 type:complete len:210 (-) Transcript_23260:1107-1736(-)
MRSSLLLPTVLSSRGPVALPWLGVLRFPLKLQNQRFKVSMRPPRQAKCCLTLLHGMASEVYTRGSPQELRAHSSQMVSVWLFTESYRRKCANRLQILHCKQSLHVACVSNRSIAPSKFILVSNRACKHFSSANPISNKDASFLDSSSPLPATASTADATTTSPSSSSSLNLAVVVTAATTLVLVGTPPLSTPSAHRSSWPSSPTSRLRR